MLSFHTWRLCAVVSLWAWGATGESTYLGCFKDASVLRDFNPETQVRTVTLSPSFCETHCKLVGGGPYRYFALQNGDLCYCSQTYGRYGASDLCTTKCVGGSTPPASQGMCGGHDANAVYSIVGVDRLINAIPGGEAVQHNNTSGNSQQQHQQQQQQQAKPESKIEVKKFGCFRDKSPGRAFSGEPMEDERMTPSKCARHCVDQAARYMALQDGNQCFCGNSPGDKLGKSTKCTKACAGDGATTCGGPFANQVYELSVVTATPAPGSPEALPAGASSAGLFAVATINCGVPGAVLVAGAAVFLTSYGSRAHCTTVALANTNTYAKAAASVFVGAVLAQVAAVYVAALLGHILPDSRMFSPYVTKLLSAAACVTCGLTQVSRSFDVASRDQDELRDELFAAMADHGDTKSDIEYGDKGSGYAFDGVGTVYRVFLTVVAEGWGGVTQTCVVALACVVDIAPVLQGAAAAQVFAAALACTGLPNSALLLNGTALKLHFCSGLLFFFLAINAIMELNDV